MKMQPIVVEIQVLRRPWWRRAGDFLREFVTGAADPEDLGDPVEGFVELDDAPLTFARVSEVNRSRCERWHPGFPGDEWTAADWSNAVCGEAGELANVVKKIRRFDCGVPGPDDPELSELLEMAADEMADVYCYLDLLASYFDIDLAAAVIDKFNRVSERQGFPERLP